ncbi:hypothetical protein Lal_00018243 [Lupinus albus]|nr:hypothetical protein Lal_00018243 [Lupinus albus]
MIKVVAAKCTPMNEIYIGPCFSDLVCVQICTTEGFDDGKCLKLQLRCKCYKGCMKSIGMGAPQAQFVKSNDGY